MITNLKAVILPLGSSEPAAVVKFLDGKVRVECVDPVLKLTLYSFLTAPHTLDTRNANQQREKRILAPGTAEHLALRLEALGGIGMRAHVTSRG